MPYPQDHFFAKLTFLCVMVSSFSPEWNGLGLDHLGLCTNTPNMSLWFLPSDVYFSLIFLKTTESFFDGFSVEKLFPCIVKGNKHIQCGTRLTENSNNSHSNLAISHLGWSQKFPMGGTELNFPHFLQTAEQHAASFLSQSQALTVNSASTRTDSDCILYSGKSTFL